MDLPILTVDTDGMELYDKGEEKAWKELFLVFAGEKEDVIFGQNRDTWHDTTGYQ